MDKKWDLSEINTPQAQSLASQLNIHPALGGLLIQRGITDFEKARSFFRPDLDTLHDPFLMKDLNLAVNRLSEALARNETILIYGDYDVDGTTSVALMYLFLKNHCNHLLINSKWVCYRQENNLVIKNLNNIWKLQTSKM